MYGTFSPFIEDKYSDYIFRVELLIIPASWVISSTHEQFVGRVQLLSQRKSSFSSETAPLLVDVEPVTKTVRYALDTQCT